MRMHGHAAHDDMKYVPKEKVEEWRAKDPIDRQTRRLEALGVDVEAIRAEVKTEIERGRRGGAGRPDARRRDGDATACSPTSPRCSRTATRPGPASPKEA